MTNFILLLLGACTGPALDIPVLVPIPGGRFAMGSEAGEKAELPVHGVAIAPFAMSRTEITFDQWQACAAAGACRTIADDHGWGRGARPVINVSWDDARTYASWLSGIIGRPVRLPREAEWEYAARAGTSTAFWWGDDIGAHHANCRDCQSGFDHRTAPVASFKANPFGLHDMNGNVWEWVEECWTADYSTPAAATCDQRVIRGGAWYYFGRLARASQRSAFDSALGSYSIGFRVVAEQ